MSEEIYELFNEPSLSEVVKMKRLTWLGDLKNMDNTRVVKRIVDTVPNGKKKVGHEEENIRVKLYCRM